MTWVMTVGSFLFRPLLEGIEHFQARSAKMPIVAGHDGEVVPTGGGGNVAVLDRHGLPNAGKLVTQREPRRLGNVKSIDSTFHRPE